MHEHHRQRVRERFLKEGGLDSFEEHQALELLLFYAIPRKDTNEIAHKLLNTFGNIKNLFNADINDIADIDGMGEYSATLIKLIPEFCRYYLSTQEGDKQYIRNIDQAISVIKPLLYGKAYENIYMFCLDERFVLKHYELLNKGSLTDVKFSMKDVAKIAFRFNSEKILFAHNHPSGSPKPSPTDIETTLQAAEALKPFSIQLIDHIILTDNDYHSFAEQKMISLDHNSNEVKAAQYTGVWFSEF